MLLVRERHNHCESITDVITLFDITVHDDELDGGVSTFKDKEECGWFCRGLVSLEQS